jgi:hypothetical protein
MISPCSVLAKQGNRKKETSIILEIDSFGGKSEGYYLLSMDYSKFHNALLLGEADFSFAFAFAQEFTGSITASEYGSGDDIANRYFDGGTEKLAALLNANRDSHSHSNSNSAVHIVSSLDARVLGDEQNCTCERWNGTSSSWDPPTRFWDNTQQNHNTSYDIVIFNFPHTDKNGKAPRLLRALLKQLRQCVQDGRLPSTVVLEMRLRDDEDENENNTRTNHVRAAYKHEEAAAESMFELIGTFDNDLERWEKLGYEHRMTKRRASCRGLPCKVLRWRPKQDAVDFILNEE